MEWTDALIASVQGAKSDADLGSPLANDMGSFPSGLWDPSWTLSASLLKAKVTGLTARIALVDVGTTQLPDWTS